MALVEVLDLTNGQIEEGHAITDFDDGLWSNATHGSTETTVELEDSELAEDGSIWLRLDVVVCDNLVWLWWRNAVPVPVNSSISKQCPLEENIRVQTYKVLPLALSLR